MAKERRSHERSCAIDLRPDGQGFRPGGGLPHVGGSGLVPAFKVALAVGS